METSQTEIFFLSPDIVADLKYYRTAKGIKPSVLINEAVTIGTSFIDKIELKHTFILDGRPYQLPVVNPATPPPTPYDVNIFPTQLKRLKYISDHLETDIRKALEWCVTCWAAIYQIRHLEQTLACISPEGRIIPAQDICS